MSNDLEGLGEQISAGRHLNGRQLGAAAICRQDPRLSLYGLPGSSGLSRHPLRRVTPRAEPRRAPGPSEEEPPPPPNRAPPRSRRRRAGETGRAAPRSAAHTHSGGANGSGSCGVRPVSVGGKILISLSYLRGGRRGGVVQRCLAKLPGASSAGVRRAPTFPLRCWGFGRCYISRP